MAATAKDARARTRRSREQVREAILEAARTVFSQSGYAAARTKQIAEVAGASEQLIFAHFGSKQQLFEEAVLAPLTDFLVTFVDSFAEGDEDEFGPGEEFSNFVGGFFRMLLTNRRLLVAYVAASTFHGDEFETLQPDAGLEAGIRQLRELAERLARDHAFVLADSALHVRVILATLLGLTVFDDMLFPTRSVDEDSIVAATAGLLLSGFMGVQDSSA